MTAAVQVSGPRLMRPAAEPIAAGQVVGLDAEGRLILCSSKVPGRDRPVGLAVATAEAAGQRITVATDTAIVRAPSLGGTVGQVGRVAELPGAVSWAPGSTAVVAYRLSDELATVAVELTAIDLDAQPGPQPPDVPFLEAYPPALWWDAFDPTTMETDGGRQAQIGDPVWRWYSKGRGAPVPLIASSGMIGSAVKPVTPPTLSPGGLLFDGTNVLRTPPETEGRTTCVIDGFGGACFVRGDALGKLRTMVCGNGNFNYLPGFSLYTGGTANPGFTVPHLLLGNGKHPIKGDIELSPIEKNQALGVWIEGDRIFYADDAEIQGQAPQNADPYPTGSYFSFWVGTRPAFDRNNVMIGHIETIVILDVPTTAETWRAFQAWNGMA